MVFKAGLWLVLSAAWLGAQTDAEEESFPLAFSGFVDVQGRLADPDDDNGFTIYDGALYIDSGNDTYQLHIDLPFFGGGDDNDFAFASEKAQAFISGTHAGGFTWQVGQFDSIIGFEDNDSVGRAFATGAAVAGDPFPSTFTGVQAGVARDVWAVSFMVSNAGDSGSLDGDVTLGAVVSWEKDRLHGYLSTISQDAPGGRDTTAELNLGGALGALALDLAYTQTLPEVGDDGHTVLLQGVYEHGGSWGWGWRLEEATYQSDYRDAEAVTLGLSRKLSGRLLIKGDLLYARRRAYDEPDRAEEKGALVSALMRF